jgi:bile acid:Na+ symporter, BASS family
MIRLVSAATNLFPAWVLAGGVMALLRPQWFTWFNGEWITWGLAVIMLGMGITLSLDDFKAVLRTPRAVAIGLLAQFCISRSSVGALRACSGWKLPWLSV